MVEKKKAPKKATKKVVKKQPSLPKLLGISVQREKEIKDVVCGEIAHGMLTCGKVNQTFEAVMERFEGAGQMESIYIGYVIGRMLSSIDEMGMLS